MVKRKPGELLPLEVHILEAGLALQSSHGDFYGFALARKLAERDGGGGLTAHGTLYKALGRLADAGLLESSWEDAALAEAEGRPRRRHYRVSGAGARALAASRAGRPVPGTEPGTAFA